MPTCMEFNRFPYRSTVLQANEAADVTWYEGDSHAIAAGTPQYMPRDEFVVSEGGNEDVLEVLSPSGDLVRNWLQGMKSANMVELEGQALTKFEEYRNVAQGTH